MKLYIPTALFLYLVAIQSGAANAQARRSQHLLAPQEHLHLQGEDASLQSDLPGDVTISPHLPAKNGSLASSAFRDLVGALDVMQNSYFELWQGAWPSSIDWTAAVLGTHVSATLSSLTSSKDDNLMSSHTDDLDESDDDDSGHDDLASMLTRKLRETSLGFENLINHFFAHTSAFYFGENAFALRNQAYDDMLWVVLGWLENIKFQVLHSDLRYGPSQSGTNTTRAWHGTQFRVAAAHRARLFYELASSGWDVLLCNGGMIWSPYLIPYKNAITNELFISASIEMYLYFPGDVIDSPFAAQSPGKDGHLYDPVFLRAAIEGYRWLQNSNMTGENGLYGDGFHINGWESSLQPGTRNCDVLNSMVYTYNQGVILSGLRGLWLATGSEEYLNDGHQLVQKVIQATGWPYKSNKIWAGLGRGGILEDTCDASGSCSQDGQTFKSIFFHHFIEFCRAIRPQEERFLEYAWRQTPGREARSWAVVYGGHRTRCLEYRPWVEHNAQAAMNTRDENGKFGMWWGKGYGVQDASVAGSSSPLPRGAIDYRNHGEQGEDSGELIGTLPSRNATEDAAEDARTRAFDKGHQSKMSARPPPDYNNRGRGRTAETQAGGVAVLRALYEWRQMP